MTDLTLRRTLGRPLEWEEMDVNMENLDSDSPWNVASGHIWYSGKVSLYGDDATYDLDFTNGVANVATIGTNDADLEVHVDGARKFKIITNTQNRFQVTTDGKVGINIDSDPTYELDVDGNIRARTTLFANQANANSFYDGTATLSGGSLTNAVNAEFTGQVRFGSLYDITNDHIIRELDVLDLTEFLDRIPTSYAVKTFVDNADSDVQARLDSEHAWNVAQHDSEHAWNVAQHDSEHTWNIAQHDSEHAWANSNFDSEHAWNVAEHDSLQSWTSSNINRIDVRLDSEHSWNVAQHDSEHSWASSNFDSEHNYNRLEHSQLQASIDSVAATLTSTTLQNVTETGSTTTVDITAPHFVGQLTGTLTNARLINGTSFDASSDITTSTWGTARDISIGGTSKSINGSGNYTWTSGEITAGKVSNSFTVQGTSFDGSTAQSVSFTGGTGISIAGTTITNDAPDQTVAITGTGATSVSGTYPTFTVNSTDTTYTAGTGLTLVGTEFRNTAPDQTVAITGGGATTVTGTYPTFTVSSTDTTYTGGTGISIAGTTITNDAPDRTVAITGTGATTVSGTYPTFTVNSTNTTYTAGTGLTLVGTEFRNTAPDQTVSLTGAGSTTVTGTYPNFTITSVAGSYTLPLATASARGGVKIGYSTSGKNYAVQLSSEKMYVNVPWTDTNTTYTAGNGLQLSGTQFSMTGSYTGTFTASGDVVAFSDIALKEDINPISAALEKVTQLTGYTFRRKGEEKVSTGVMAQEVQKVLPEAVHDNEGTLGVAYGNMVGLLIEAVKELSGKVESLESELNRTK